MVRDEVSMAVFKEDFEEESLCIDLDNQIRVPAGHKAAVKLEVKASLLEEEAGVELVGVGLDCTVSKNGKSLSLQGDSRKWAFCEL